MQQLGHLNFLLGDLFSLRSSELQSVFISESGSSLTSKQVLSWSEFELISSMFGYLHNICPSRYLSSTLFVKNNSYRVSPSSISGFAVNLFSKCSMLSPELLGTFRIVSGSLIKSSSANISARHSFVSPNNSLCDITMFPSPQMIFKSGVDDCNIRLNSSTGLYFSVFIGFSFINRRICSSLLCLLF